MSYAITVQFSRCWPRKSDDNGEFRYCHSNYAEVYNQFAASIRLNIQRQWAEQYVLLTSRVRRSTDILPYTVRFEVEFSVPYVPPILRT